MRHVLVSSLIFASAIMLGPPAASSSPQVGGVGLTIFADPNFRGRSATLRDDTPDFRTIGMNDVPSSLQVAPGEQWEVCEHINYGGRCIVVTGTESDLRRINFNRIMSSARRVRGGGRGRGGGSMPNGLELFANTGFGGDMRAFTGPESDLGRVRFNSVAQSLRIRPGQQWQVCSSTNFRNCLVVNTDWSDLRGLNMSRRISSVRPWQQGGTAVPRGSVVLFDQRNFRGQPFRIDNQDGQLRGFANRAQSAQVTGGTWDLCDRANFGGRCVVVSGNVPDLSSIGLAGRVASVRISRSTR